MGTSFSIAKAGEFGKDHPHACGDKPEAVKIMSPAEGSSPRVWGQVFCACCCIFIVRIIPTRVGTSFIFHSVIGCTRDHPHACGDKFHHNQYQALYPRIIPTRVGTSLQKNKGNGVNRDHPHACGDKSLYLHFTRLRLGSSPRVWGQEGINEAIWREAGIIPTRVGTRSFARR